MCGAIAAMPAMNIKPVSNLVNNSPVGYAYKATSGGTSLTDSVKSGSAFAGLAGSAMMERAKKSSTQYSQAGGRSSV